MQANDVNEIKAKLDMLVRLMAISLLDGKKPVDQMVFLERAGFGPTAIADMIGTTPHTVSVTLSRMRKSLTNGTQGATSLKGRGGRGKQADAAN